MKFVRKRTESGTVSPNLSKLFPISSCSISALSMRYSSIPHSSQVGPYTAETGTFNYRHNSNRNNRRRFNSYVLPISIVPSRTECFVLHLPVSSKLVPNGFQGHTEPLIPRLSSYPQGFVRGKTEYRRKSDSVTS